MDRWMMMMASPTTPLFLANSRFGESCTFLQVGHSCMVTEFSENP